MNTITKEMNKEWHFPKGFKMLVTTMPDGSKWGVAVAEIARNRAEHYAHEFCINDQRSEADVERSLSEDTLPLFEADPDEITDWAENNMNWEDFKEHYLIEGAPATDFQEGWVNGEKTFQTFE
ncbi:hypothetical protein LCGC14_1677520 [marine sediment metagenome]|uniref:Uncharacterized protein n=1 Tax=marine sediment metagenome TaxID=412755 RepID=A0A0F9K596_9ZZZZ